MIVTRVNKLLSGIDNAERSLHTVRAYIVTMINDGYNQNSRVLFDQEGLSI